MNRTVSFQTLGCKLNQYETDSLATDFQKAGWEIVPFGKEALVQIINTCTVTNKADRKSRNTVHKAEKTARGTLVIVTGCFAQSARDELEGRDGITYVVDNQNKSQIFNLVEAHYRGEDPSGTIPVGTIKSTPSQALFDYSVADKIYHTRATVKVQDGCDNFCTYCIIPFVRGPAVSRPLEQVVENIKALVDKGFKEIILTGINITTYDDQGKNFEDLLERILEVEGDWRLRVSSVEPENLGPRFFKLLNHPRLCPQIHLCLQSGSPKVLSEMKRNYTLETFTNLAQALRKENPDFNITTDLIAGFPGETLEDHQASLKALEQFTFGHVHIFPYSRRKGTKADLAENQISEDEKTKRTLELEALMVQEKLRYRKFLLGKTQTVLVERVTGNRGYGMGENYVPVEFTLDGVQWNQFYPVQLLSLGEGEEPLFEGLPCAGA